MFTIYESELTDSCIDKTAALINIDTLFEVVWILMHWTLLRLFSSAECLRKISVKVIETRNIRLKEL